MVSPCMNISSSVPDSANLSNRPTACPMPPLSAKRSHFLQCRHGYVRVFRVRMGIFTGPVMTEAESAERAKHAATV